jgi:hypothetical protein
MGFFQAKRKKIKNFMKKLVFVCFRLPQI